jgi:hypothetical protein
MLLETFIPPWLTNARGKAGKSAEASKAKANANDEIAMDIFRQRISMHQAAMGSHYQRAPGFDYVRWKQQGQHRMHHNPDEYVHTCQGLAPYINSVAGSSFEGLEERRWAGLTQAPPSLGLQPRSASRSNFGSKELLNK